MNAHTPGPWRWEFNKSHKSIYLSGGKPLHDKTVMQFERWGMNGATPLFNSQITGDQYNVMERVCDQPTWTTPYPGREHHASWCMDVIHPDARLISAAPDLLEALQEAITCGMVPISSAAEGGASKHSRQVAVADMIRAAIAKATGETP